MSKTLSDIEQDNLFETLLKLGKLEENELYGVYEIGKEEILKNEITIDGLEVIKESGGGEGGGESCYTIFKFKETFYKTTYSYYSFHGFDFDDMETSIVTPKEETVIIYN